jgi:hypothetical protein
MKKALYINLDEESPDIAIPRKWRCDISEGGRRWRRRSVFDQRSREASQQAEYVHVARG